MLHAVRGDLPSPPNKNTQEETVTPIALSPQFKPSVEPARRCHYRPSLQTLWETDFYPVPVLGRTALSPLPDPSPVLDKNRAPMGPEMLSSTGAGVCREAPEAFPDSSSVLDRFQSGTLTSYIRSLGRFS